MIKPKEIDPLVQQIFDDILAFMGDDYTVTNCYVTQDGQGTNQGITAEDANRNRWSYTEYIVGFRVTVTPANAVLGPGGTQQFTATARDAEGAPVAAPSFIWTVQPGGLGTVSAAGLYTAPATLAAASSDTLRCQLSGAASWTTLLVSLVP